MRSVIHTVILATLSLFPISSLAGFSGELGGRLDDRDNVVGQFEVAFSDVSDPFYVSAIAVDTDEEAESVRLALGVLGVSWNWGRLEAGRVAAPLGLTAPVHAFRPAMAGQAGVTSSFTRAVKSVFGVADVGGAIALTHGRWETKLTVYHSRKSTRTETVSLVNFFGLDREPPDIEIGLLTPGECSSCQILSTLFGMGRPEDGFTPFVLDFADELLGQFGVAPETDPVESVTSAPVYAISAYWAGHNARFTADFAQAELFDEQVSYGILGYERGGLYGLFGVQAVVASGTTGVLAFGVGSLGRWEPYIRMGQFSGGLDASEIAFGTVLHLSRFNFKLEYENASADLGDDSFSIDTVSFATSVSF